jgi:hypothetical protein
MVSCISAKQGIALVGLGGVILIELVNLATHGPDSTVTTASVGAITALVGFCFGRNARSPK